MQVSPRTRLFLASFLLLYFELVLIRWIPGHVRVLAYFTNFVLIACFFGMGLGLLLARSSVDTVRLAALALALPVALAVLFEGAWIGTSGGVFLFLEYEGKTHHPMAVVPVLLVFYLAVSAALLPLGQAVGKGFGGPSPLADYSANLLGSLAGIGVFSAWSLFSLPPWVWFLAAAPLLALLPSAKSWRAITVVAGALLAALVHHADRGTIWSPYHKLEIAPMAVDPKTGSLYPFQREENARPLPLDVGFDLRVNDDFYQLPVDLRDATVARFPELAPWRDRSCIFCRLPADLERVLIVGGGTGNDAAQALRHGAKQVDVVDIDPGIVEIGRRMHPERPYSDPRVRVIIDDARHFFHRATPGYDAVVFALLDSHRLMGTRSSLRLDSYVFTVESFREARRLLSSRGVQATAFAVGQEWMRSRFYEMLRAAYGEEPVVVDEHGVETVGTVFLSGPGATKASGMEIRPRPADGGALLATDDWPFIYARAREIPVDYLLVLAVVLLLSAGGVAAAGSRRLPDRHFFFLGAAFLLLETRNVTALALAFGSTWYVNAVVFGTILTMSLGANLVTLQVRQLPWIVLYGGLFAAVLLYWFLPFEALVGYGLALRLLLVGGASALPVFFSGLIFARSFATTSDPAHALASNVLGAIVGGTVEYLSMVTGLRFLLLLMAGLYALSIAGGGRRASAAAPP